jgi:hypothetical protein
VGQRSALESEQVRINRRIRKIVDAIAALAVKCN